MTDHDSTHSTRTGGGTGGGTGGSPSAHSGGLVRSAEHRYANPVDHDKVTARRK
jgi:hypothetical protein